MTHYDGWRDVRIVWNDGTVEVISVLGRPDPYVTKDNVLRLKVSYENEYRHIPLTSIREWSTKEY